MSAIRELGLGKRDRKRFINVEFRLNRDDPHWTPPLRADRMKYMDPSKNPFFEHAEVAHFVAETTHGHREPRAAERGRPHVDPAPTRAEVHRHAEQTDRALRRTGLQALDS